MGDHLVCGAMTKKVKRRIMIYASIGIGGAILWSIIHWVGWRRITHEFLSLGALGGAVFFANALLIFFLWALTWRILLRAYGVERSWRELLGAFAAGYTITYITPSANFGGEPVRVYMITHGFKEQTHEATSSVIVERFLNMGSAILLLFIGSVYGLFTDRLSHFFRWGLFAWASAGVLFFAWAIVSFRRHYPWMTKSLRILARLIPWRGYLERATVWFERVEREIDCAFSPRKRHHTQLAFIPAVLSSVLYALNPLIFLYFTAGTVLSVLDLSLIFALSMFLNMFLWITPGGMGVIDGGLIGIFALFGVGKAAAVGFSFALKLTEITYVLFGITYMLSHGASHFLHRSVKRIPQEAQ